MGDTTQLVVERGKVYISRSRYVSLHVFSKNYILLESLTKAFGGGIYQHGVGFLWILTNRELLEQLAKQLPSNHSLVTALEETDLPQRT